MSAAAAPKAPVVAERSARGCKAAAALSQTPSARCAAAARSLAVYPARARQRARAFAAWALQRPMAFLKHPLLLCEDALIADCSACPWPARAGPGMLAFPAAYQEGGLLLGISFTLLFAGLSIFTSTLITKVVTHVKQTKQDRAQSLDGKGSEHSAQFVEYDTIVQATGNKALLVTFQIAFLLSMTLMSISCICIVARALDNLSITVLGNAWGLQILPDLRIRPSCRSGEDCRARQAFQDTSDVHGYVITQGYFLTLAVSGPFSLLDINDWFQGVTYFISLVCLLEMIAVFSYIAWAPSSACPAQHLRAAMH